MERTKFPQNTERELYPIQEEPIILSKPLLDILLKEQNSPDLIGLYCFYYYTAKWQHTTQPHATTRYTAEGLGWSEVKVRRIKEQLKKLNLIEDVDKRDALGKIVGHFVKIHFIWNVPNSPTLTVSHTVGNREGNAYIISNITNTSRMDAGEDVPNSPKHIVPNQFESFWKIYPRKTDKGRALTMWNKLCSRPTNKRPSWREIKRAILAQKESERWQDPKFIPHPATWLNQSRWLDDPKEMKRFDYGDNGKKKYIIDDGIKYTLCPDGRYRDSGGSVYIE